ncbi:unannotated protein [freshwater metagenome]|uniref:tRNA(Ile)-lysidine synthetase n=1 Tax=freshwater metagenome TaxID=449393 RepID=A0A6J7XRJ7_9ZZZZ|nr:tRNA lysidine(34) synthetase TilS [Actinomycetota bacterium]
MESTPNLIALRLAVRKVLMQFTAGDVVIVATSGGADSLSLAYVASLEAVPLALQIIGVTIDHQLQHGSQKQAQKVTDQLRSLGLQEAKIIQVHVNKTDGMEASARRARYEALENYATSCDAVAILLGHTRDDQAETVLLGLARGSGARSLSGMAPENGKYFRPLLNITRAQTVGACIEANLVPWEDPHNSDEQYARVRVRRAVLPILEKNLGPGVSDALARTAALLRDDADALDALADEQFASMEPSSLEVQRLSNLPKALRTRILRLAIYAIGAPSGSISADHVAVIEALVTSWHGQGEIDLPGGVKVRRISGRLSLSARS